MRGKFLVLGSILLSVSSCRTGSNSSDVEQIIAGRDTPCDVYQERVPTMGTKYNSFIISATSQQERQDAFGTFSRIPTPYLEFVFTKSHAQVQLTGKCQPGLTSWSGNSEGRVPTLITSGSRTSGDFCDRTDTLSHEMGHASVGAVERQHPDFQAALDQQYSFSVSQGHETNALASYPQTNREEYFAELFDQYYCSALARDRLRTKLPSSYAFAVKYLLPPDSTDDTDKDGVPDWADLCPGSVGDPVTGGFENPPYKVWNKDTPDQSADDVAQTEKLNGCNVGQIPGQDGAYRHSGSYKQIFDAPPSKYETEVLASQVPVLLAIYPKDCQDCAALRTLFESMAQSNDGWYKTFMLEASSDPERVKNYAVQDPTKPQIYVIYKKLIYAGFTTPIQMPQTKASLMTQLNRAIPNH